MTRVEVPDEQRDAFEDALDRECFVCHHPIRDHISQSKCGCCAKGVGKPSEQATQLMETAAQILRGVSKRR